MTNKLQTDDSDRLAFRQSRHAAIIVVADPGRWTVLDVNDSYLAVTGHAREALVGVPLFDAFPESTETIEEHGSHRVAASLEEAITGRRSVLPVQRYDLPSAAAVGAFAEHYWEMSSAPLRNGAGEIVAVLHEVENVTVRERAATQLEERTEEAELARQTAERERARTDGILESMADAYFVLDDQFRFIAANHAMEKGGGIPREELLGHTVWELFPTTLGTAWERNYRKVMAERVPVHFTQ